MLIIYSVLFNNILYIDNIRLFGFVLGINYLFFLLLKLFWLVLSNINFKWHTILQVFFSVDLCSDMSITSLPKRFIIIFQFLWTTFNTINLQWSLTRDYCTIKLDILNIFFYITLVLFHSGRFLRSNKFSICIIHILYILFLLTGSTWLSRTL